MSLCWAPACTRRATEVGGGAGGTGIRRCLACAAVCCREFEGAAAAKSAARAVAHETSNEFLWHPIKWLRY